jgi:hypothetical protein
LLVVSRQWSANAPGIARSCKGQRIHSAALLVLLTTDNWTSSARTPPRRCTSQGFLLGRPLADPAARIAQLVKKDEELWVAAGDGKL